MAMKIGKYGIHLSVWPEVFAKWAIVTHWHHQVVFYMGRLHVAVGIYNALPPYVNK